MTPEKSGRARELCEKRTKKAVRMKEHKKESFQVSSDQMERFLKIFENMEKDLQKIAKNGEGADFSQVLENIRKNREDN